MTRHGLTAAERFWMKVRKDESGCWLWTAALTSNGYGQVMIGGRNRRAHRVSFESLVGPIPDGFEIDHLCRVRTCVNPEHLEPVTHAENQRRMGAVKTHCLRGHPLSGDNLLNGVPNRKCRTCQYARARTYRANRRARLAVAS